MDDIELIIEVTDIETLEIPFGEDGNPGADGWAPIIASAADGARRVLRIVDWVGGTGDKPAIGYVGINGPVDLIADGIDVRGPAGADAVAIDGEDGEDGDDGLNGWTPTLATVEDGERRVHQVIDWTGGSGAKPATGKYVGAAGLVAAIADGIDIRGAAGVDAVATDGEDGDDGLNGWTPTLATVNDGARRVLQVIDWTGGTGAKPATGKYVGAAGLVAAIADGIDIRGPAGVDAVATDGLNGWTPTLATVNDGARRVQQVIDWTGGSGAKPATGKYVGAAGLVAAVGDGIDIRGPAGVDAVATDGEDGEDGDDGLNGWTPTLATVNDGARRVHQVIDWTGGSGAKPATGKYVGAAGLVAAVADGIDIRGATGATGSGSIVPYLSLQGIDTGGPFDVSGLPLQAISLDGVTASEFNMEDCDQLRTIQFYGLQGMNTDTGADEYPVIKLARCSGLKQFGCDIGAEVWEDDPDAEAPLPAPSDAISFAGLPIEWLDFSYTNLAFLDLSEVDTLKSMVLYSSTGPTVDIRHMTVLEQCELYDNAERNITTRIEAGGLTSLRYFRAMLYAVEFASFAGCTDIDELTMESNALTDIDITDVKASRVYLDFTALTQTAVDHVLMTLDASGAENGEVSMREGPAAPSPIMGMAAKIGLESKGWTVDVET